MKVYPPLPPKPSAKPLLLESDLALAGVHPWNLTSNLLSTNASGDVGPLAPGAR